MGNWGLTTDPIFSDFVLNHQGLEELYVDKNLFFFILVPLKVDGVGSVITYQPPDTHDYPRGGGVVFSTVNIRFKKDFGFPKKLS